MLCRPTPKINLGLHVIRRREDGYHDLETLFVPWRGMSDVLEIEQADRLSVNIEGCTWDPMKDLTVRAWELLREEFGVPPVAIRMKKGIPVGAGLGGGSADAAAALKMMSEMFGLSFSENELARRAARLGSDCAFFIYDRPMFGEGRGEVLTPFDIDIRNYEIRVEVPCGVAVSTKEAYGGLVLRDASSRRPLRDALAAGPRQWKGMLENDFEESVFAAHPEIAALKQRFYDEGAVYASMSGSGSAVFGLFEKL